LQAEAAPMRAKAKTAKNFMIDCWKLAAIEPVSTLDFEDAFIPVGYEVNTCGGTFLVETHSNVCFEVSSQEGKLSFVRFFYFANVCSLDKKTLIVCEGGNNWFGALFKEASSLSFKFDLCEVV